MVDIKSLAMEIADSFKFEASSFIATATTDGIESKSNLAPCDNHLDTVFMKSLENNEFLDAKYLPKSR